MPSSLQERLFVCALEHARTSLKSKMHFPGHFRSQSIYTTHSCSTCTTFALSAQQKPLLSSRRGTQRTLSSFQGAIDSLTGEVQWRECVSDCIWSLSTVPAQFAHQLVILHSWWEGQSLQELKLLDTLFKFVYFPKWSAPPRRIAVYRCKPLNSSHVWIRKSLILPQISLFPNLDSLHQTLLLLNLSQEDLYQPHHF